MPGGCVVRYVIRPGIAELTLRVFHMPASGWIVGTACRSINKCSALRTAERTSSTPDADGAHTWTARIPLTATTASGVTRFCAMANITGIGVPGQPPQPIVSTPLECLNLDSVLLPGAGAYSFTVERDGLRLHGWAIDLTTDNAGQFTFRNGTDPTAVTATTAAGSTEPRSQKRWPGFSAQHGFDIVVPFRGRAGPSAVCAVLGQHTLRCFPHEERPMSFGPAQNVTQGGTIPVSLRNVGPGTTVTVNFQSAGGYFLVPWTHRDKWTATATPTGAVELSIDSSFFPPGRYTLAFTCQPECPGGTLPAGDLVGGENWAGLITLGPAITVTPATAAALVTSRPDADTLRVTGSGFAASQLLRVVVVANAGLFDGPPIEASPVVYPVADSSGAFNVDVAAGGLPLGAGGTQVIAFADDGRPAAATIYYP